MPKTWFLTSRPEGLPDLDNLELRSVDPLPLQEGDVRVRNNWLSVDPINRIRMRADTQGGHNSIPLGHPMSGIATGEVIESKSPLLKAGDKVKHQLGWREEAVGAAELFGKLPAIDAPEQYFMHYMGVVGFTAYAGLVHTAQAKEGETAFISAAGGGVGSAAVQIAKILGLRVIGSAGGAQKTAYVRSIGADEAIDYKAPGSLLEKLRAVAPDGIDVYFDNVGGDHLDAALAVARQRARFAISGTVSSYNSNEATSLEHFFRVVFQNIRIEGFISPREYGDGLLAFQHQMAAWIKEGRVQARETIFEGVESTLDAFRAIFTGNLPGKILVRL